MESSALVAHRCLHTLRSLSGAPRVENPTCIILVHVSSARGKLPHGQDKEQTPSLPETLSPASSMFSCLPDFIEKEILTHYFSCCSLTKDRRCMMCVSKSWNHLLTDHEKTTRSRCFLYHSIGVPLCGLHDSDQVECILYIMTHVLVHENPIHIHHIPMVEVVKCVHLLRSSLGVRLSIWHFCCSGQGVCVRYDPAYEYNFIEGVL